MKRNVLLLASALLLLAPASRAAGTAFFLGARLHPEHSMVAEWPYADDPSYGFSLAFYDGMGYLELGLDYAPESSVYGIESVWTPRAMLVVSDKFLAIGLGILDNYVSFEDDRLDADWSDLLYQFYLGLEIPAGNLRLGGGAYYTFDDWGNLGDFDTDDLEYGFHLGLVF